MFLHIPLSAIVLSIHSLQGYKVINELSLDISDPTAGFISRGYWLDFHRTLNGIVGTCIELGLDVLSQVLLPFHHQFGGCPIAQSAAAIWVGERLEISRSGFIPSASIQQEPCYKRGKHSITRNASYSKASGRIRTRVIKIRTIERGEKKSIHRP